MTCDDNQGHHITKLQDMRAFVSRMKYPYWVFDNDEMICDLSDPPLSSVELDSEKSGYEAARLMEQMIESKDLLGARCYCEGNTGSNRHSTDIFCQQG